MFENERKESEAFFNYFSDKFNEEVGLLLAFYDDDEFEIDLIVGMDTETIYGLNILQYVSSEEGDEEFGNQDEENSDYVKGDDEEDDIDEEDDSDEDEENDFIEEIQYMFVKMEISPSNLEGKPYFQIDLAETSKEQEEKQSAEDDDNVNSLPQLEENALRLIIYAKPLNGFEDEDITDLPGEKIRLTGAVMIKGNDKESLVVFSEDPSIG
ncbi:MAG: hypothetical protein K9W44_05910 [Candidatus Lokiarchaeota archaeon]|nr:hypothetical protein [Candidatus Harpocratesius repetitus]